MFLEESEFYPMLFDYIKSGKQVENIKVHNGKIYAFTLNSTSRKSIQVKTNKNEMGTIWDILEYIKFSRITKYRFYGEDTILRNGYFGGLVGQDLDNIKLWENMPEETRLKFSMYDIDINKAYLNCLYMDLPYSRLFRIEEVNRELHSSMIKFYHIKLKSEPNELNLFIPPHPKPEFINFDFLAQKPNKEMVVSEIRYKLIQEIYGTLCYELIQIYVIPKKQYGFLHDFVDDYEKRIESMKLRKEKPEVISNAKTQALTLIGLFGKKDEKKVITGIKIEDDKMYVQHEFKKKKCANYLPMCMYINDVVARRLFDMCKEEKYNLICWNTDGWVAFVLKEIRVENSKRIGELKSEVIHEPKFLNCDLLFKRPLIIDMKTNKVYNSKAIEFESEEFYFTQFMHSNRRSGYFYEKKRDKIRAYKVDYRFNVRKEEITTLLYGYDTFHELRYKCANINKDEKQEYMKEEYNKQLKHLANIWRSKTFL